MQKDGIQSDSSIVVKTKDGRFKLWKNGQFEDLPSEEVMARHEEIVAHTPMTVMEIKPMANFYFSVEDEEEAKKISINQTKVDNQKIKEFIEALAALIVKESGLPESRVNTNLKHIIISRLREVRSRAETREALLKPAAFGGAELSKEEAEGIIVLAEHNCKKAEEAIRSGKIEQFNVEDKSGKSAPLAREPVAKNDFPEIKYEKGEDRAYGEGGAGHRTMGAVEEIAALSLADFRKLGENSTESANRVFEKINLLEDESLLKKNEGIKAWQRSEAGRLYLIIGTMSMTQKITVREAIEKRKNSGQSYLTPEEFDAVADLNHRLTY